MAMVEMCMRASSLLKKTLVLLGQRAPSLFEIFGEMVPFTELRGNRLPPVQDIDAVWFDRVSPFPEYQQLIFTGVPEWAGMVFEEDDGSETGLSIPSLLFPILLHAAIGYEDLEELDRNDRRDLANRIFKNCYALSNVPMVPGRVPAGYAKCLILMKKMHDIYFVNKGREMGFSWNDWLWETRKKCFRGLRVRRILHCLEMGLRPES
ncbi:MAG: hypothetical protein C4529_09620 [Deltaproteobacteria bacterium]|nr:MAG: hypothetical protein C4529_09620 [Deltaproteobacteria bacterium]